MVDKLRQFADKMILIKRHQLASLDKKSTDVLPKKKNKKKTDNEKVLYLLSKRRPAPNTAKWENKSERSHSKWGKMKYEAESRMTA